MQTKNASETNFRKIVPVWWNSAPTRRHCTVALSGYTWRNKRLVTIDSYYILLISCGHNVDCSGSLL